MPPENQPRSLPYSPSFADRPIRGYSTELDVNEWEYPTRSPQLCNTLYDFYEYCPEAAKAIELYVAYTLGSGGGDELGFTLKWTGQRRVATAAIDILRKVPIGDWMTVVWRLLAWGDCFASISIDEKYQLDRLLLLPTWQIFRDEDVYGSLLGFQQRQLGPASPVISLSNATTIHWRYAPRYMYGRSLFKESIPDWKELRFLMIEGMPEAARSVAIQPNLHLMPEGAGQDYKASYRAEHEARKRQGLIPDIYLSHGADFRKPIGLPSVAPFDGLLNYIALLRRRIAVRSGVPLYLLGIDDTRGARELSLQPAATFVLSVGIIRQILAMGVRHFVDVGLALRGFTPPYIYDVVFPRITVNPFEMGTTDTDLPGVNDVGDA